MNLDSQQSHKRLFLGIPIAEELRSEILMASETSRGETGLTFTPPQNLHVTILFIGAVQVEMVSNLIALIQLSLKGFHSFSLKSPSWTYAPTGKPPRMVWVRYQKGEFFPALVQSMRTTIGSVVQLPQQYQDPIPHITVARFKPKGHLPAFALPVSPTGGELTVNKLVLWESVLSQSGASYLPLAEFNLTQR